jgi:hypothetical protein
MFHCKPINALTRLEPIPEPDSNLFGVGSSTVVAVREQGRYGCEARAFGPELRPFAKVSKPPRRKECRMCSFI